MLLSSLRPSPVNARSETFSRRTVKLQLSARRNFSVVAVAAPERPHISRSDEELGSELKAKFQSFESYPAPVYGANNLGCSEEEWKSRVDLAAAYRLACRLGFNEGIVNHFTAWVPEVEVMLVHPFGLAWEEVTAKNLISVDLEGNVVRGEGKPEATAFFIHSRLHLKRPRETLAVLHTHQPWSTALALLEDPTLPMVHQNCLRFFEDLVNDTHYGGLVTSFEEGDRLAATLGAKRTLLHSNHGVIICAETMYQAFDYLYYLERAAEVVVKARSTGMPLRVLADEVAREFKECFIEGPGKEYARLHFEALKRQLLASEQHSNFLG
ncbi:hypothetical protein WJX74_008270 [Apatococcus lobatus]|uniref:Class II aldolase/adducin N-terminal domain-containing protein n=1 Tax=Apatococcus lobatus TaxID=904363 RepID=A0AAW1QDN2_9CHLO